MLQQVKNIYIFFKRHCISPIFKCFSSLRAQYSMHKLLANNIGITSEHTRYNTCSLADRKNPAFTQVVSLNKIYDLQVIIPVYNAEPYLRQCVDSILAQNTKYNFITVFVNDGSTDNSGEILNEYAKNNQIIVIHQENRGHSGARNRALENILGRYVMFVDSDDYIPANAVEVLMDEAMKQNADVVEGSHIPFSEEMEYAPFIHSKGLVLDDTALTGYPWGKVIRSEHFTDLCFPQEIWFEDTIIKTLLYPKCKVIATVPEIVYYYRQNPNSISHTCRNDIRCLDTYWITQFYLEEMKSRGYDFGTKEYEHFLLQCRRNHQRLEKMEQATRKSVFVLECELLETYFSSVKCPKGNKYKLEEKSMKAKSYEAFCYIQDHWTSL